MDKVLSSPALGSDGEGLKAAIPVVKKGKWKMWGRGTVRSSSVGGKGPS